MSTKPLIGITAGEIRNVIEPWASVTVGQSYPYIDAVIHAGGTPFIIPISADEAVRRQLYDLADGILFAGGNDVDPARYGQAAGPHTEDISQARDDQEWQLMEWALKDDKPVLAICRGLQLLNVVQGGSLHQHIPADLPTAQNHDASKQHQDTTYLAHTLRLEPGSKLADILQTTAVATNSRHHQALHEVGQELVITGWAEDDVIEAVELPTKQFVLGVQSHPEGLEAAVEPKWQLLFKAFVQAAQAIPGQS